MNRGSRINASDARRILGKARLNFPNGCLDPNDHRFGAPIKRVIVRTHWRGLIDRYIDKEIGVCLYLRLRPGNIPSNLEGRDFAIVFQQSVIDDHHIFQLNTIGKSQLGVSIGCPSTDDVKLPVPVFACPVIENSESAVRVQNKEVVVQGRSIVRLYRLDDAPTLLREWPDLPTCILETGARSTDRKFKMLVIGGRVLAGVNDGCGIDTGIQRASQLVQELAEFETECVRKPSLESWRNPDASCPVVLYIEARRIQIAFANSFIPQRGEGFVVCLCACDTVPARFEWKKWHDVYSGHEEGKVPQAADLKGTRNPRPAARGVPARSQEGGEGQTLNSAQTEEVAPQTAPDHHSGGCTAKHTHLGSPEDAYTVKG